MLNFTVNLVHHFDVVRTVVFRHLPPRCGGKGGGIDIKQRIVLYIRENAPSYLHFLPWGQTPWIKRMCAFTL